MRILALATGVAALALTAPAVAQKGGDRNGHGGGGKPAKLERGGGGGQQARSQRGGGDERAVRSERRVERQQARVERRGGGEMRARQAERRQARIERPARIERAERRNDQPVRGVRIERKNDDRVREARLRDDRFDRRNEDLRIVRRDDDRRNGYAFRYAGNDRGRGLIDGCPPGLAAKNNGCLPPGQAKQLVGRALPAVYASSLLPAAYRNWYPDNDRYYYREGDGLIYRIARSTGLVDGYSPLWGYGANYQPDYYYAGERYPLDYVSFYNVPVAYQDYYRDNDEWLYRYGDGGIYQVNRSTGLVEAIVALLAGDLAVGQPLPAGYDVYNVPYAYRDRYYDRPDAWYRYSDGYIYQVDPKTRLIQAVIQALV